MEISTGLIVCDMLLIMFVAANYEEYVEEENATVDKNGGILSSCSYEFTTFSAVMANGRYLLFYDPECNLCVNLICEQKVKRGWEQKTCVPSPVNCWYWFGPFSPGKTNTYRVYHKMTQRLYINGSIYFLPEEPPPVQEVDVQPGPGYVWLYITPVEENATNLLGYRVSLLDTSPGGGDGGGGGGGGGGWGWRVVGEYDIAVYHCTEPHLFPLHPCPSWRAPRRRFCVLLTDAIDWNWTNDPLPLNARNMYVKVETFRLPEKKERRVYSRDFIVPLFKTSTNMSSSTAEGSGEEWWQVWGNLLLAVVVCVLVSGLPIVHFRGTRVGKEEAEELIRQGLIPDNCDADQKKKCSKWRQLKRKANKEQQESGCPNLDTS